MLFSEAALIGLIPECFPESPGMLNHIRVPRYMHMYQLYAMSLLK